MHLLTSNFNLLDTNSNWSYLKNKNFHIDKNFNNFFFLINDKKTFLKYESIHIILNYEKSNKKELIKKILSLKKYNQEHIIIFYFFLNFSKKFLLKEIKYLSKNIQRINKNIYINFLNNYSEIKFNKRNYKQISFPFEINSLEKITKIIINKNKASLAKPYKLIILDCDNTLWGGVLDEDGKKKLLYANTGKGLIYYNFQKILKSLKEKGFILSVSSKNEEKKVWEAMKYKKMFLQKKDFIFSKINWSEKEHNIKSILASMSLRPEDTLFIDDNLIEIEKVKNAIPGINYIHFNKNKIIQQFYNDQRLKKKIVLQEDKKKYDQYKLKFKFEDLKDKNKYVQNDFNFIKSLGQKIKFVNYGLRNSKRTLQLFHKTNQFNFTLNRYTHIELSNILKNKKNSIKLLNFRDRFGNHGLVGLYLIKEDKNSVVIKDFLLSCRVLFRKIEDYIIYKLSRNYNSKKIIIEFRETTLNNKLVPNFLKSSYFDILNKKGKLSLYTIKPNKTLNETKKLFSSSS